MFLTLFLQGASPPSHLNAVGRGAHGGQSPPVFFHYRFIDLSLISRHGASPPVNPHSLRHFMIYVTCHKRSRDLCAVGFSILHAVGQGVHGGRSPLSQKIEMFSDGMVECSDKTKTHRNNGINISKQLLDRDCTARDASVTTQNPRTRRRRKMEPTQVWSLPTLQNRTGRQVRIHIQLHPQQSERHHDVL